LLQHSLFQTLFNLKGNPRWSVFTEPLWGIPYNLYAPYVSVYMLAFGLKDEQIGLLVSISLIVQIMSAALSGAITDKLGRRKTTAIFDFISWTVPTIIWAISQNFNYFLVAALFNGTWRITHTSWSCLLVEDADPDQLVDIYSWIYIAGLLSAFFAPLAGLLIDRFTLIPTMRGLYIFAAIFMSAKFIILYIFSTETQQGAVRLQETKHQSLLDLLGEYKGVFSQLLRTPSTLYTLGLMIVLSITGMISGSFWSILVTEKLHIPPEHIAIYPFARSIVMMLFFFIAMPRVKEFKFRNPMLVALGGFILGQLMLIYAPEKGYAVLLVQTILEACSYAVLGTLVDRMVVITVDAQERARIISILLLLVVIFTTPFGWIAGSLSGVNRIFPFILNICLFITAGWLVLQAARSADKAVKL
jgi:MFS family permease